MNNLIWVGLDFFLCFGYNGTANRWTGIEVVITALTRNQVVSQEARGFESHPVRQKETVTRKGGCFLFGRSLVGIRTRAVVNGAPGELRRRAAGGG